MNSDFEKLLIAALDAAGIDHHALPLDKLQSFYVMLERWQRSLNLTGIRDAKGIVDRHFCESLFIVHLLDRAAGTLLDFGSGNGFPAIPIKIAVPELGITMVEARKRKCHFLNAAVRELGLLQVRIMNRRFKKLSELGGGEQFDYFTMRAVGNAPGMLGELHLIMKRGGKAFVYAGKKNLPLLNALADTISAQRQEILIPGRKGSYVFMLTMP